VGFGLGARGQRNEREQDPDKGNRVYSPQQARPSLAELRPQTL
jgi:hypothetical protein